MKSVAEEVKLQNQKDINEQLMQRKQETEWQLMAAVAGNTSAVRTLDARANHVDIRPQIAQTKI